MSSGSGENTLPAARAASNHASSGLPALTLPERLTIVRAVRRCRFGAVAQLGERIVRNDEVRGSIPLGSTKRGNSRVQPNNLRQQYRTPDGTSENSADGARTLAAEPQVSLPAPR